MEKRMKGVGWGKIFQVWSRLVLFNMKYRWCLLAKLVTDAVGRCLQQPMVAFPVAELEN